MSTPGPALGPASAIGAASLVAGQSRARGPEVPRWKRVLDLCIAVPFLVLALPIMVVAALLVRLSGPGPVILRQTRIGLGGEPFTLLKFRTMVCDAVDDGAARDAIARELGGEAVPESGGLFRPAHDPRITPVGAILRRLSVDELPQLFNVLRGEMAIVGPRPALPWEVEMFSAEQRRRHDCLPGITGLWQVSGRNRVSSLQMLEFDLQYASQYRLSLDLKIIARTPAAVFRRNTR